MLSFLTENLGTIIVVLVLALVVFLIVRMLLHDKARGKSLCGNNCAHCAAAGTCHANRGAQGKRRAGQKEA